MVTATSFFHATQNETDGDAANVWSLSRCESYFEGANMPATSMPSTYCVVVLTDPQAANAGGVGTHSEMAKTANVSHGHANMDGRLKDIMTNTAKQLQKLRSW